MAAMIDGSGMVRLFRVSAEQVWHVLERGDEADLVAPCGVTLARGGAELQTIDAGSILAAGRICLTCAQALIESQ